MKKIFSVLAIAVSVGIAAVAVTPMELLNTEVDRILSAFRNAETTARLEFTQLATDSNRALQLAVNGAYRKVGVKRAFGIVLDNLSYDYGTGISPTSKIAGSIEFDLTRFVSQDEINKFGANFEKTVKELAADFGKEYGTAATVDAKVLRVGVDTANNYTSLAAQLTLKIDLSALPATMKVEDVMFTEGAATISIEVNQGLKGDLMLVSNPLYRGFTSTEDGLKEFVDKLLARDPAELAKFEGLVKRLDDFAHKYGN